MNVCLYCLKTVNNRYARYCSNRCQLDFQYKQYIQRWKTGSANGSRGIRAKNISGHLRRYLFEKYGGKCTQCSWSIVNPTTLTVPLEIDHIDGDAENNSEENLRLLCPNCHALTPNFRNLNKGKGRLWRREKYLKVTI
jgi:5-methylcytosine-specific restriction endonuclease McrA